MSPFLRIRNQSGDRVGRDTLELLRRAGTAALEAGARDRGLSLRGPRADLTLVDAERMRELNRGHLGRDSATDVLAFSLWENGAAAEPAVRDDPSPQLLGDVVVSVPQAREQAAERGHGLEGELALLVAHGVLHLLGYEDGSADGAALMRRLQSQALQAAGVPAAVADEPEAGASSAGGTGGAGGAGGQGMGGARVR